MLKQLLFTLVATLLLFAPETFAHTYLDSTNPPDGATITEEIQTIELNYSGKIEEGSIFKVLASNGSEMAMESITLNDGRLTGTFGSPLPNDTYTVKWDSISEDGHPLSGSFSFTVNEHVADNGKVSSADTSKQIESDVSSIVDTLKTETDSEDGNSIWGLIIVLGIIIVIFAVLTVYTYKRSFIKRKNNK